MSVENIETIEAGRKHVRKLLFQKAKERGIEIESAEWRAIRSENDTVIEDRDFAENSILDVKAGGNIADKIFTEEELRFCQTNNQHEWRVAMKIESILVNIK
jgi:hypothetical protein